jgi:hypothetical protein
MVYDVSLARSPTTSDAFNAVAEPRRRQILDLLAAGELPANDVVGSLGLVQPQVSKHLRVLRSVGLVSVRGSGMAGVSLCFFSWCGRVAAANTPRGEPAIGSRTTGTTGAEEGRRCSHVPVLRNGAVGARTFGLAIGDLPTQAWPGDPNRLVMNGLGSSRSSAHQETPGGAIQCLFFPISAPLAAMWHPPSTVGRLVWRDTARYNQAILTHSNRALWSWRWPKLWDRISRRWINGGWRCRGLPCAQIFPK